MDGCGSGARSDDRPSLLAAIGEPGDLQRLDRGELRALADEIRSFLVDTVCRTGGHLGPNLGVVELTLALHRVFRSPSDTILWDTGHQAYVHKILTGRHDLFDRLRQPDGLSGYPSRAESEHDVIENSHASTALAWADGISKGHRLRGVTGRQVVAVIGDGALTGGMAWEALNNISAGDGQPVIIVLNDNGRSYAPTVGGLADHLAHLRSTPAQPRLAGWQRAVFGRPVPTGDRPAAQEPASDDIDARNLFECIGLRYLGPVDGHDMTAVETALRTARELRQSVVVHCVTKKGMGHPAAEQHEGDRMHVVRATRPAGTVPARPTWTSVFGREMVALGAERPDIVAMTAAMLEPVGLDAFATRFPSRVFDVGIAEQHAVTSAAGLATAGAHPVIALYATFLNRAFDQVLMDAALHRCGMTLVLDRAGMTGDDGPSHNGMWDLSLLRLVPGLRVAAPRDGTQLRTQLREAVAVEHAPTVLRFPKGDVPQDIVAVGRTGEVDILYRPSSGGGAPPDQPSVLLVSAGAMAATCLAVAERLGALGIPVTVVDPRWLCPVPSALIRLATRHSLVVTVEDNVRAGGFGCLLAQTLRDCSVYVPLQDFGIPHRFIEQGTRAQLLAEAGLSAPAISTGIVDLIDRLNSDPASGWQAVHGMELVS